MFRTHQHPTPNTQHRAPSTEEYWYTIYKTDGTELKLSQDELDYVETYEGEFDQRITQQIPQEYLEKMSAHMPIYSGNTPPAIEGTYVLSPLLLHYSSDGQSLNNLADQFIRMTNQDTSKNTVMYEDKQASNYKERTEMVVLGKDNNFTIFAVVPGYLGSVTYKLATIVSGTMTDAGIKDCHIALLMVDKNDPDNQVMKVGTYRIFKDKDGLAEPSSWSSRTTDRQSLGTGLSSIIAAE